MSDNTPITMTGIQELFDKLTITLTTKIDDLDNRLAAIEKSDKSLQQPRRWIRNAFLNSSLKRKHDTSWTTPTASSSKEKRRKR